MIGMLIAIALIVAAVALVVFQLRARSKGRKGPLSSCGCGSSGCSAASSCSSCGRDAGSR